MGVPGLTPRASPPARYKTFPPGWGGIRVPLDSRTAALAALALYPACHRGARWAQQAAWTGVRALGPRVLPGSAREWRPPTGAAAWERLTDAWRTAIGGWDTMAVTERLQENRGGFGLLLVRGGTPRAYLKLRRNPESAARERAALEAVAASKPRAFTAPEPLAAGEVDGWHWLAMTALPPRLHRAPGDPPLAEIVADIERALAPLPRPPEIPARWRPMHGDLTPWNLRLVPGDPAPGLALVDWEEAGWGPPLADAVLYRCTEAALRGQPPRDVPGGEEAARHWRRIFAARSRNGRDGRLATKVLAAIVVLLEGAGK